jgi:hypothetical protein
MPPRKKSQQLDLVDQANALPPIGHNSATTDNDLIAENHKLEDLIKAAQAKFNEWAKPHKARIEQIENELLKRLQDRGAKNTRTDAGTAYISHPMNPEIESREKLFDWIAENWETVGSDAKIGIKVETIRAHMDEHEGEPPPGIKVKYFTNLNINRS